MANESTSSTLSELYTEIVAEALFVASEQSIMRPLVKNYAIQGGGKSVEVPIYGVVSASAVSEATDLSNTAINPTSVTITASENGIMTTLTDLARNSAPRNVAGDIGKLFGEAIAKKIDTDLNLRAILAIGIFQVLALIPGVSRAGIVITAGRLLNFDRYDSAKISFFLSVPAIAGASFLNLKELTFSNIEVNFIVLLAVICSFIFSYITIKYFLIFVKKFSMNFFVIYRVCLGLVLFWFIYT